MMRPFSRLVCSVAYFAETYGVRVIQLALDILNRKSVPPAIFIQHELLTPENVDKIYPNDAWIKNAPKRQILYPRPLPSTRNHHIKLFLRMLHPFTYPKQP